MRSEADQSEWITEHHGEMHKQPCQHEWVPWLWWPPEKVRICNRCGQLEQLRRAAPILPWKSRAHRE